MKDHKVNFISGFIVFAAIVGLFYCPPSLEEQKSIAQILTDMDSECRNPGFRNRAIRK